jgi:hypothetical protein
VDDRTITSRQYQAAVYLYAENAVREALTVGPLSWRMIVKVVAEAVVRCEELTRTHGYVVVPSALLN